MFSFKPSRIKYEEVLGEGHFGSVHPYQKNEDDDRWVVKIQSVLSHNLPTRIQEIVLGFSFDHPNVLPIKGFHIEYLDQKKRWEIYIKMPRMAGTLRSKLKENILEKKYFSDKDIIRYFYDITCGLAYLHQKKIVHRDIKLDNVLLDKNGSVVISDIGLGKLIDLESSYVTEDKAGSSYYMAPELQESKEPLKKKALYNTDAWSLGMSIANLCLLKTEILMTDLSGKQKEKELTEQLESIRGQYDDSSFIDLVLMLLKHDPEKRISIQDVKQKLEEKYPEILDSSNLTDFGRMSGFFGGNSGKKGFETPLRRSMVGVAEAEIDPQIWKDRLKDVEKELEKTKKEFLQFKRERLQALAQDLEASTTFIFGGQKLFIFEVSLCNPLAGVFIQPTDPSKITDHDFKMLIQAFTNKLDQHNWKQLDLLRLHLVNCIQITDKSMAALSLDLETKLTSLKFLQINLYNCKNITDTGVVLLMGLIGGRLKALESLFMYFGCPNITDYGAQKLIQQIANNLSSLQELCLGFNKCGISDIAINEMIKHIPSHFKNLRGLYIYLSSCIKITENTVIQLVNQIAINLQNIQIFELDLSECNISDQILFQLAKDFKNGFKNLRRFGFLMNNCKNIKDAALLELVTKMSFKKILRLKLGFINCTQISEQTIKNIGMIIEINLQQLQDLYLGLNNIPLEETNRSFLREHLKFIPKLALGL